jgi:hypothetical protein
MFHAPRASLEHDCQVGEVRGHSCSSQAEADAGTTSFDQRFEKRVEMPRPVVLGMLWGRLGERHNDKASLRVSHDALLWEAGMCGRAPSGVYPTRSSPRSGTRRAPRPRRPPSRAGAAPGASKRTAGDLGRVPQGAIDGRLLRSSGRTGQVLSPRLAHHGGDAQTLEVRPMLRHSLQGLAVAAVAALTLGPSPPAAVTPIRRVQHP